MRPANFFLIPYFSTLLVLVLHFTSLLIKLLMHKLEVSFWKSTKIGQKQGIKSNEKLYILKYVITDIFMMCIFTSIDHWQF